MKTGYLIVVTTAIASLSDSALASEFSKLSNSQPLLAALTSIHGSPRAGEPPIFNIATTPEQQKKPKRPRTNLEIILPITDPSQQQELKIESTFSPRSNPFNKPITPKRITIHKPWEFASTINYVNSYGLNDPSDSDYESSELDSDGDSQ